MDQVAQLQMAVAMLAVFTAGLAFLLVREVRRLTRKVDKLEGDAREKAREQFRAGWAKKLDDEIPF